MLYGLMFAPFCKAILHAFYVICRLYAKSTGTDAISVLKASPCERSNEATPDRPWLLRGLEPRASLRIAFAPEPSLRSVKIL